MNKACLSVIVFLLTGCASVLNPYKDEFQCPETYNGRCAGMRTAYDESVANVDSEAVARMQAACDKDDEKCLEAYKPLLQHQDRAAMAGRAFREKQYRKMTRLMDEPVAPVLVPPEVVRVLILSYTTRDNMFLGDRYGYFMATEPTFILSTTSYAKGGIHASGR